MFKEVIESDVEKLKPRIKLLLITVTPEETIEVRKRLKPFNNQKHPLVLHHNADAYYLGIFGYYGAVHVQCRQGSFGSRGASAILSTALEFWNPNAVVMPGIAYGKSEVSQAIKDILITEAIRTFTYGKVEGHFNENTKTGKFLNSLLPDKFITRGREIPSGHILYSKFTSHFIDQTIQLPGANKKSRIHSGLVLSDNVLLNSRKKKKELFEKFDDAIGGEMEGHAIASICSGRKLEWIVVKSICDWGDGTKENTFHQQCSEISAEMCLNVFSQLTPFSGLNIHPYSQKNTNTVYFQSAHASKTMKAIKPNSQYGFQSLTAEILKTFTGISSALLQTVVYILAEYIMNAFEHGGATEIQYNLEGGKIVIYDNGKKFDPLSKESIKYQTKGLSRGIGLKLFQERIEREKGNLSVRYSHANEKNVLEVSLPISNDNSGSGFESFVITLDPNTAFTRKFENNFLIPDDIESIKIFVAKGYPFISGLTMMLSHVLDKLKGRKCKIIISVDSTEIDQMVEILSGFQSFFDKNNITFEKR